MPDAPQKSSFLVFVQSWLPIIVVVFGLLANAWKYFDEKAEKAAAAQAVALLEAQRPFLTKKMELFFEASQIGGILVTVEPATKEWEEAKKRFYALRWSELEMTGNPAIREAMRSVIVRFLSVEGNPRDEKTRHDLRWKVECLADELRLSLEESWGRSDDYYRNDPINPRRSKPTGCNAGQAPAN